MQKPTQRELAEFVSNNVHYCVSTLVHTLAQDCAKAFGNLVLEDLCAQAAELSYPIPDYEEAAIQEGWTGPHKDKYGATYFQDSSDGMTWACDSWRELGEEFEIDPYEREVYEHWIVDQRLAAKLEAKGERVDYDFAGLVVWGRTCTGQAIHLDCVIEDIWCEMRAPVE